MSAHCCDHAHEHGAAAAASPVYRRVLWTALVVNFAMFAVEIGAGLAAQSASLLADSLDFLGDGANYGISLFVLGMALQWRARASLLKAASMAAFGHSPGHMIFQVESEGKQLVLTADTANHFVLSLQKPEWEVKFDMDKAAAAASRKKVFDMVATDRVAFLGYHMPFPAVGYAEKLDTGYRFVPKSYQFDI